MNEIKRIAERINVTRHRSPRSPDDSLGISGKIVAVLYNEKTRERRRYVTSNVITNNGDIYYAERGSGKATTALTVNFNVLELNNNSTFSSPGKTDVYGTLVSTKYITGSTKVVSAGYPVNNDTNANNSGSSNSIVTYLFEYVKGDFSSTAIVRGVIRSTATQTTGSAILTHFAFASAFTKTTDDTLSVFVNHAMLGSS